MNRYFKQISGDKDSIGKIVKIIKETDYQCKLQTLKSKFKYSITKASFEKHYQQIQKEPRRKNEKE